MKKFSLIFQNNSRIDTDPLLPTNILPLLHAHLSITNFALYRCVSTYTYTSSSFSNYSASAYVNNGDVDIVEIGDLLSPN
jgi:hypothetical protein